MATNDDGDDRIWGVDCAGEKGYFSHFLLPPPHNVRGSRCPEGRAGRNRTNGKEILESSGPPAVRSPRWRRINYDKVI